MPRSKRTAVAPTLRPKPSSKVTQQNSEGLRQALFDAMDQLRNGKISSATANATAHLAEQIVSTVQLEMDIERHAHNLGKRGHRLNDLLPPLVPLGNREEHDVETFDPDAIDDDSE